MKTSSAKAKGRDLQKFVRDLILANSIGLTEDDVRSTAMGQGGEDVQLSSLARQQFPYSIECKSRASFAFYKDYEQAKRNTPEGSEPLLVCKANYKKPVVIVDADYFFSKVKPND
jgi:hypothetical protein